MQMNPYLSFNGNCEEAFNFYEKNLGGKILASMTYEGTPMAEQVPAEWRKKIIHARMALGETLLMGSDAMPDRYEGTKGFSLNLNAKDPAEAERLFLALSEKATVTMTLQPTFWALRFGMLVDQFGISWMVNCEKPR